MASFGTSPGTLGPYRLIEKLGTGAMGTVFLAEQGGERAALKVFHPHLVGRAGFFQRFQREAEAGLKVRHPNVVRTEDFDFIWSDDEPVCFLVMEHVEGITLRELLEELGTLPEGMLREVAAQTAAGLAAIHAAGIVHRDLKPENVLITEDERVRIMDLGVAKLLDAATALTLSGQFAGSLHYAAPEQFQQGEVGPWSDLYSLGVMLYELASGENPFKRDTPAAMVGAHLDYVPIRLSERNPELSAFLAEVVSVLLAKAPEDRFSDAELLEEVLREGEKSRWWAAREPELFRVRGGMPRISVRRETALHGREDELGRLRESWEEARAGTGLTILVEGEAGIGKTRLIDGFLAELGADDAHVLYGSYAPSGGLGGMSEAIVARFGRAGLAETLHRFLPHTPTLVPAFAAVVKHENRPEGSAPLQGDALHAVFCHLARGLAEDRPLLWIVDDLHFAEPESRKLLLSIARAIQDSRALLVLTTRPGLPEEEVSPFVRLPRFEKIKLGRLSPREVVLLLRDAFKSDTLADRLGARIAFKSDGVPFFLFEMLQGLKERHFLRERPDGTWVESAIISNIEVPSAVRDLISARLGGLSEDDRHLLDVGAVQGFEFDGDLVAAICEQKPVRVLQQLATLARRTRVVRPAGRLFRFDHHVVQELIYEQIPERLRLEYHAALADAYLAQQDGDESELSEEACCFIATNHLKGSRPEGGVPYLTRALTHLENSFRSEQALELARRALDEPGLLEPGDRVDVLLKESQRLSLIGRMAESKVALDRALEVADEMGDLCRRGWVRCRIGAHFSFVRASEARKWAHEAVELAERCGDPELLAMATGSLGSIHMRLADYPEARRWFERELEVAEKTGDRRLIGSAIGSLGNLLSMLGRYEEACDHYRRAIPIMHEARDRRGEVAYLGNLGNIHFQSGRLEEAREAFTKAHDACREAGYRRGEAIAYGNLGNIYGHMGRHEAARDHFANSFEIIREVGDEEIEASAIVNLAICLAELGRLRSARARLRVARDQCRESGMQRILGYAEQGLGLVEEHAGRDRRAEPIHAQALAIFTAIRYPTGTALASLSLGRCLARMGRADEARPRLETAVEVGRNLEHPSLFVPALAYLARIGGDPDAALEALAESGHRMTHLAGLETRFLLWRTTADPTCLEEARRMLDEFLEHAPAEYGDSIVDNVALYRQIREAAPPE